jgi:hypothetical protein
VPISNGNSGALTTASCGTGSAMWLVSGINAADIGRPSTGHRHCRPDRRGQPGRTVHTERPAGHASAGAGSVRLDRPLYILDDGSDVAMVRLQGESPDLWIVDRFSGDGGSRRCAWPGIDGVRELPSRFNRQDSYGPTQPRSQCRGFSLLPHRAFIGGYLKPISAS